MLVLVVGASVTRRHGSCQLQANEVEAFVGKVWQAHHCHISTISFLPYNLTPGCIQLKRRNGRGPIKGAMQGLGRERRILRSNSADV